MEPISPLLEVRHTAHKGRAVFTTRPLPSGTPILHTLPYAIGVFPSHRKRLCAFLPCSLTADTYFSCRCHACDAAFYCGDVCRGRNARKHAWICAGMRRLKGWSKDRHVAGVLGLVLEVLAQGRVDEMDSASASRDESPDDALREEIYRNLLSWDTGLDADSRTRTAICRPTLADVLNLQSHFSSWPSEELEDWTRHSSFISSVFSACAPGLLPAGWELNDILDLASKLESNGFGCFWGESNVVTRLADEGTADGGQERFQESMSSAGRSKSGVCFARAMYPHASYFNHSCAPNTQADPLTALEIFEAPTSAADSTSTEATALKHLRTIGLGRPATFSLALGQGEILAAGEEITISYISLALPRSSRRARLSDEYHFDCTCERCEEEDRGKAFKRNTTKEKVPKKKSKR